MLNTEDQGLTERDLVQQRDDAMREGVKALFLMNGGGAVALLAFLQAIWNKDPGLSHWIVCGLVFLLLGVGLAGLVHFLRAHMWDAAQDILHCLRAESRDADKLIAVTNRADWMRRAYFICAYISLFGFAVGVGLVLYGAATTPDLVRPSYPEF